MGSGEEYLPSGHTFVIADDHPLFRGALKEALAGIGDVAAIHEAGDFEGAKALVLANEDIDMVLLPYQLAFTMPGICPELARSRKAMRDSLNLR